jgi:dinuclear metal center YbgI/SA1388 family protein
VIIRDLAAKLDQWFPTRLAESWDNVGLLLGDETAPVTRVMTTLSLTESSAQEAIRERVDLVVSHHPIFFRKIARLTAQGPDRPAYLLARGGVGLYSPHTSFDGGAAGINEQWAQRLGLSDITPLEPAEQAPTCKLVVFVPESDLAKVSQALFEAGAGRIGEYSECSFRLAGTGTFRGSDESHPTVGQAGRHEEVAEHRLEVIVPLARISSVVSALRRSHSYEEPAYDVYPLIAGADRLGAGRLGWLPEPVPLEELARRAGKASGARRVEIVGPGDALCRSVGIGCGSAASLMPMAARAGCDVFLTGEARFHDYLEAERLGIRLILVGHYESERFALEELAHRLRAEFPGLECWASRHETNPSRALFLEG